MSQRVLTLEEWFANWQPLPNEFDNIEPSLIHEGVAYGLRPVGEQAIYVQLLSPMRHVWTAHSDGGIRPGYRWHDRQHVFYVVAFRPYAAADIDSLVVDNTDNM